MLSKSISHPPAPPPPQKKVNLAFNYKFSHFHFGKAQTKCVQSLSRSCASQTIELNVNMI